MMDKLKKLMPCMDNKACMMGCACMAGAGVCWWLGLLGIVGCGIMAGCGGAMAGMHWLKDHMMAMFK